VADERSDYPDRVIETEFKFIHKEITDLHKTLNGLPLELVEIKTAQRAQSQKLDGIEQTLTGGRWSKATVIPLVFGVCSVILMLVALTLTLVTL